MADIGVTRMTDRLAVIESKMALLKKIRLPFAWKAEISSAPNQSYFLSIVTPQGEGLRWPIPINISDNTLIDAVYKATTALAHDMVRRGFMVDGVAVFHPDNNIHKIVELYRPASAKSMQSDMVEAAKKAMDMAARVEKVIKTLAINMSIDSSLIDRTRVESLVEKSMDMKGQELAIMPIDMLTPNGKRLMALRERERQRQAINTTKPPVSKSAAKRARKRGK